MFLAGCSDPKGRGAIFGSPDGAQWDLLYQEETKDRAYTFYAFTESDGLTVAVGGGDGMSKSGPARVLTSRDAKTWSGPVFKFENSGPFLCIARGKDRVVAHGGSGYASCFTHSTDGQTWADPDKNRLPGYGGEQSMIKKLAWGNGVFVGVGGYRRLVTSADGITWKDNPDKDRPAFLSLSFGNGRFVAGGMHGLRMSSTDGLHWEHREDGEIGEHLNEIVWTGEAFVAVGIEVTYQSPDGAKWTRHPTTVRASRAAYGGGLFLCANLRGTEAHRSRDAVTWDRIPPIKDHLFFGGFGFRAG